MKVMNVAHFFTRGLSFAVHKVSRVTSSTMESYQKAIKTLNSVQSNVEYIKYAKIKNNQQNNMSEMTKFLHRSGLTLDQLDSLPVIHIAGTNGKGTTCAYCENILRCHGLKTGFYSSPHLLETRERIRINGQPISKEKFAEHFWRIYNQLDRQKSDPYDMPLYFRFLTIMALHIFIQEQVDVAILEVGIGGEYDCTNIVRKTLVAGITPLDIDHTALLGDSLQSIAWNKAGIMKKGAKVFTAPQSEIAMDILKKRSEEKECALEVVKDFYSKSKSKTIPENIQKLNASMALAISEAFLKIATINNNRGKQFDIELAQQSIESCHWPGRYEIIDRSNSRYFLDGAHTVQPIQVCVDWFLSKISNSVQNEQNGYNHVQNGNTTDAVEHKKYRTLIFNVTGEREPEKLMKFLLKCQFDSVIFIPNVGHDSETKDNEDHIQTVQKQLQRCQIHKDLWQQLDQEAQVEIFPSFIRAVNFLESQNEKKFDVLVTGSIHLIGAAMSVLDPSLGGTL